MEKGRIEVDERHTVRHIRSSMQGSVIRALVELITNSDDSYSRLEHQDEKVEGIIEITYKKEGKIGYFSVKDSAEGMSYERIKEGFTKYGSLTSDMEIYNKVRGYFGQGAKDALASMLDGKIISIKDGLLTECKVFIESGINKNDSLNYELNGPFEVTEEKRKQYKIQKNGTLALFSADPRINSSIPQFDTVHEQLSNHYLLRKIMSNPKRIIILENKDNKNRRKIKFVNPSGKNLIEENIKLKYNENYDEFNIFLSIFRSDTELTQTGDDRQGGILIIEENNSVLDISLFKYNNEPLANHFFGEARIEGFRKLLINNETVLSEEREGLKNKHPFCIKLIKEIENQIEIALIKEKEIRKKEDKLKFSNEEIKKYIKAFSYLNEIAEEEAQIVTSLGKNLTDEQIPPPDGFILYPPKANITINKKYNLDLIINTKQISNGTMISIESSTNKIKIIGNKDILIKQDSNTSSILRKHVTIQGEEINIDGVLSAKLNNKAAHSKIQVIPEKELLYDEGMAFLPESKTLRPNQPQKVNLLVYTKIIDHGSEITISSDNENVNISEDKILVNSLESIRDIVKYEIEIWGDKIGENAIITAKYLDFIALLEVHIRAKEESSYKNPRGMFSEPEFNNELSPNNRTSYSNESSKVIIYTNFPTIKHYLGKENEYIKTLPTQVFLADLIAERCFLEIAKKKVENSGMVMNLQGIQDRIQRDALELSSKYGKRVHEILVDQNELKISRDVLEKTDKKD